MLSVPALGPRHIAARTTNSVWSVIGTPSGGNGMATCAPRAVSNAKPGIPTAQRDALVIGGFSVRVNSVGWAMCGHCWRGTSPVWV